MRAGHNSRYQIALSSLEVTEDCLSPTDTLGDLWLELCHSATEAVRRSRIGTP